MAKCPAGNFYLCGMDRFQDTPGPRNTRMINRSIRDGEDSTIAYGVDGGGSGKSTFEEFAKLAAASGLVCRSDKLPTNKSKLQRFEPFSAACENGLVYIVESMFTSEELVALHDELEYFKGEAKTPRGRHDDVVDACSSVFSWLSTERVLKYPPRTQITTQTQAAKLLQSSKAPKLTSEGLPKLSDLSL